MEAKMEAKMEAEMEAEREKREVWLEARQHGQMRVILPTKKPASPIRPEAPSRLRTVALCAPELAPQCSPGAPPRLLRVVAQNHHFRACFDTRLTSRLTRRVCATPGAQSASCCLP